MKPLSRLEPLTEPQRAQVAAWLETSSYEKVIELARENFGVEIPRMTLSRFRERLAMTALLDESPAAVEAAAEIVQYAALGQQHFSPATLMVLERKAFELSLSCAAGSEEMTALQKISALLVRHRDTTVRERLATVQEEKCKIRREELQLKAVLQESRLDQLL
ncbi:MAG TPA: hypothetical protein VK633_04180 [Verrucomicrobiae bacterium]|nr:hypothetical protein [Verrucomicrobiae bacterium]